MTSSVQTLPIVEWLDRRTTRQRVIVLVIVITALAALVTRWVARILLDMWWYEDLGADAVWELRVASEVTLTVVAFTVTAAIMLATNRAALSVRPPAGQTPFRPVAALASRLGPARRWLAYLLPVVFATSAAKAAPAYWTEWVTFRRAAHLDRDVPSVGYDLGYHLFRMPFVSTVTAWLMSVLLVSFAMVTALLVLNGSLRLPIRRRRPSPGALRLLAAIAAAWFAVRSVDYWFVKYPSLASAPSGRFRGAGYAEMHGPGLAYRPLSIACLVAALLLLGFVLGRSRLRWGLLVSVSVVVVHIVFVVAMPPVIQRLLVDPAEAEREAEYIGYNLDATRAAYGLDHVTMSSRTLSDGVDGAAVADRVPLFEADTLAAPLQVLQGTRGTRIGDVVLDRYRHDGLLRPTFVASRNAVLDELPERGWVQDHLVYTHGDGVVVSLADQTTDGGLPGFGEVEVTSTASSAPIYFGPELDGWYVFTSTDRTELDGVTYGGSTGISMGSGWRRLVAATALGDYNVAVSDEFTAATDLLMKRSIVERVGSVAPFLTLDADPYPVAVDDDIVWVVEGYTTSSTYPYAQGAASDGSNGTTPKSGGNTNYVKHSAIATVSSADGTVDVYRADRLGADGTDPILDLWDDILPGIIQPLDDAPEGVREHLRYAPYAFAVQTNMLAQYHVPDAETLFGGTDSWVVAPSPTATTDGSAKPGEAIDLFDAPAPDGRWVVNRSYLPGAVNNPTARREELEALVFGDHLTGALHVVRLASSDSRQLTSPRVAQSLILADTEVTEMITLLNANDSKVTFGPMTPVIADDGLAWVRSLIVTGQTPAATPRVSAVLAVSGGRVGIGESAATALDDATAHSDQGS